MDERLYAVWLSEALYPGNIYGKKLIEKYGSHAAVYELGEEDYESVGIKRKSFAMSRLLEKDLTESQKILSVCDYNYFQVIEYTSKFYPQRLRAIKDPPPVLYARGRLIDFDDNVCIAVVGTRSYTDIGWNSVYKVTAGLASGGAVVITGLASGIDTAATRAALETSGYAIGVLGSGVDKIYPSENRKLFEEMYKRGLVISEKAPFSEINGRYFPVRNRLISGLSNGVLIGEGSLKSGAMYTAAHGSEQGRHIFAIPGDISSDESTGVNKLIHDGATPVFDAKDILDKYLYFYPHRIGINTAISADSVTVPSARSTKKVRVVGGKNRSLTDVSPSDEKASFTPQRITSVNVGNDTCSSVPSANVKSGFVSEVGTSIGTSKVRDNAQTPFFTQNADCRFITVDSAVEDWLTNADTVWKIDELDEENVTHEELAEFFEHGDGSASDYIAGHCNNDSEFTAFVETNMKYLDGRVKRTDAEIWGTGEDLMMDVEYMTFSEAAVIKDSSLDEEMELCLTDDLYESDVDTSGFDEIQKNVYDCICEAGSITVDGICDRTGMDLVNVNSALTMLEIGGFIESYGPYLRKKDEIEL